MSFHCIYTKEQIKKRMNFPEKTKHCLLCIGVREPVSTKGLHCPFLYRSELMDGVLDCSVLTIAAYLLSH